MTEVHAAVSDVTGTEAGATGPARSECLKGYGTGAIVSTNTLPHPVPLPKGISVNLILILDGLKN
jgi:hypothetical protein